MECPLAARRRRAAESRARTCGCIALHPPCCRPGRDPCSGDCPSRPGARRAPRRASQRRSPSAHPGYRTRRSSSPLPSRAGLASPVTVRRSTMRTPPNPIPPRTARTPPYSSSLTPSVCDYQGEVSDAPIPVCGRRLHSNATRPSGAHATPAAATGQAIPDDLAEAEASRFKPLVDRPASRAGSIDQPRRARGIVGCH